MQLENPFTLHRLRPLRGTALLVATALLVTACGSSSDDDAEFPLRVIHASPDAPLVNVSLNDNEVLSELDYKEGTGFGQVNAGTYDVTVDAITPDGDVTVIDVPNASFSPDTEYTVIAIGKAGNNTLEPLVIENVPSEVPGGQTRAQVVHAAPDAPAVSVYVTAPGADLAGSAPLGTFSFGEELGPVEVAAGDYQVRVTLANDPGTVVFDAGTVPLSAGADLLLVAVANTTTGTSPISVLVNDGNTQTELLDVNTPADVRVGHFSPNAPAVDVIVNDNLGAPLFDAVSYPTVTGYTSVPEDTYNIKVVDDATQGLTVIDANLSLVKGVAYSVLAVDFLDTIEPLVLTDDRRSIATEARVRIVHASPSAGDVDIYVVAPNTDINTVSPTLPNVPFQAFTGYVGLDGGTFEVSVTPAGDKTPVAIFDTLTVANGGIYTVIARDAVNGGAPLSLEVIDELD